ncbi:MAG TPA: tRNA uridine-5-carboxymethylaminomethyl(34) synthesis GTPase MnmE [Candidatus Acidoferrum sp.]|nr:tRNA uridine-5-carboxymethylaminomethyl(34) synthesis GTPase MnmE [Candidatus Acidoferrum sp.]
MDTIYALSSAAGRAGIAVIRLSGPGAMAALRQVVMGALPAPREAALRRLRHPQTGVELDEGMVLLFPAPRSFTGEDVAELHIHGGRAVVRSVLEALASCDGLRPAEAGEFTRRAFEHGKLDLTAAEGLADLVNAETEAQRRQALRQLRGELGDLYERWRTALLRALAHMEAHIDFPEEDLPPDLAEQTKSTIAALSAEIAAHLQDKHRGERLRDGISVVILGPPNVGKSSLLNALAGRPAAIVAAKAGTTRDVIEVQLDLAGYPVTVADTAGLRDSEDEIESEGVRRAQARAGEADIKILMVDVADYQHVAAELSALADDDALFAINKCDLAAVPPQTRLCGRPAFAISARTGAGLDSLLAALREAVVERAGLTEAPVLTRQRHRRALERCREALERALAAPGLELLAEDLRLAVRAIGRITGRVDVEDLLDVIFREFCIGK